MSDVAGYRVDDEPARAASRWGLCFCAVVLVYGGAWVVLSRVAPSEPVSVPVEAITIDLAPAPQAPPAPPALPPPAPPQVTPPDPESPKPVETPPVPPPPEPPPPDPAPPDPTPPDPTPPDPAPPVTIPVTPPAPAPEVVLPAAKPIAKPRPVRHVARPPTPVVTVPQAAPPPTPTAVSPAPAAAVPSPQITATWQSLLIAHIARFKRYPALAQKRGDQGVAYVRFVIDRDGSVLSASLDRGSGHAELDQEAVAWLQRAQPLPKPPPDIARDRMELVLPMRFELQ